MQAGAPGSAVQTSQGALHAAVTLTGFGGNQCTAVSTREEGDSDSGPLHPPALETLPLAGSHASARFQSYNVSARGNLYRA